MIAGNRILGIVFAVILSCSFIGINAAGGADPVMESVSGVVNQILNDDDTMIIEVKPSSGSTTSNWVAIPNSQVKVGDQVTLQPGSVLNNYHLNGVDRTFSKIIFSPGLSSITSGSTDSGSTYYRRRR